MKRLLPVFVMLLWSLITYAQDNFVYTPIKILERVKDNPEVPESLQNNKSYDMSKQSTSGKTEISETIGELSVSLTGGANYNVPIMVPPGINGVKPAIALTYNSQGGNGLAGYGWNISGISVITRIPSTKFHDNEIDAVDFDLMDRFALDGQRLMLKSGAYGGNGTYYETENFSNIRIISYGTSPYGSTYGPAYFVVTYPDGSFAHYGSSTDSRSRTDYAITFWQNPQGLQISYTYTMADNALSIASIKYGTKAGVTPINEIQFSYTTRKRPEQSFISGIDFRRKNLLSGIHVKTNGVGYRTYVLTHDYNALGYNRLKSIKEKSGDNTLTHSPIEFNYSTTNNSVKHTGIITDLGGANIEQRNAEVIPLDITGNGKMDFIVYNKLGTDAKKKFWLFTDLESRELSHKVCKQKITGVETPVIFCLILNFIYT